MTAEIDADIVRFLASDADWLWRRQNLRTAILIWGDNLPPGGPFLDAFAIGQEGPAAQQDTGNHNRHRGRRTAAKSRH